MNKKRAAVAAHAAVKGSSKYPGIHGEVTFRQLRNGVLVGAEIYGLPEGGECSPGIFAFHIHNGSECSGNSEDAFAAADGHFNPGDCPHPYHAGDLPPLFGNHGYAYMSVFTDRFTVGEIMRLDKDTFGNGLKSRFLDNRQATMYLKT